MELMVGGGAAAGPTPREPWPGTTIRGLRRLPRASCVCRVAPAAVCGMYELCWFRFRPFEFLFLGFFLCEPCGAQAIRLRNQEPATPKPLLLLLRLPLMHTLSLVLIYTQKVPQPCADHAAMRPSSVCVSRH